MFFFYFYNPYYVGNLLKPNMMVVLMGKLFRCNLSTHTSKSFKASSEFEIGSFLLQMVSTLLFSNSKNQLNCVIVFFCSPCSHYGACGMYPDC